MAPSFNSRSGTQVEEFRRGLLRRFRRFNVRTERSIAFSWSLAAERLACKGADERA